jgi:predicted small integral membrane protein
LWHCCSEELLSYFLCLVLTSEGSLNSVVSAFRGHGPKSFRKDCWMDSLTLEYFSLLWYIDLQCILSFWIGSHFMRSWSGTAWRSCISLLNQMFSCFLN